MCKGGPGPTHRLRKLRSHGIIALQHRTQPREPRTCDIDATTRKKTRTTPRGGCAGQDRLPALRLGAVGLSCTEPGGAPHRIPHKLSWAPCRESPAPEITPEAMCGAKKKGGDPSPKSPPCSGGCSTDPSPDSWAADLDSSLTYTDRQEHALVLDTLDASRACARAVTQTQTT